MFKKGDKVKVDQTSFSEALVGGEKLSTSPVKFCKRPAIVVLTGLNEPSRLAEVNNTLIHCEGNYYLIQARFLRYLEPTIKITCEVNGKASTLKDISEETLLNIRRNS